MGVKVAAGTTLLPEGAVPVKDDGKPVEGASPAALSGQLRGELMHLKTVRVVPNDWNPNEMDQEAFNALTEELKKVGFVEPLVVVKLPNGGVYELSLPESVTPDDGDWWMVIGGEHRWRAARANGMDVVPCVVLPEEDFGDREFQELMTIRLTVLRGDLNPEKFLKLWTKFKEKHGDDIAAKLMAFTDRDKLQKIVKEVRSNLKGNVPPEVLDKLDKRKDEIRTVEDLSKVLHEIMREHGDQVETNLIVFAFGGKRHMYVRATSDTWSVMTELLEFCRTHKVDVNSVLSKPIRQAMQAAKHAGHAPVEPEPEETPGTDEMDP